MRYSTAGFSKRSQMKIQQMAFVLVAIMIFFGFVALIYFSLTLTNISRISQQLRDNEAREIVNTISSSPELAFTSAGDCSFCIDLEKVILLKEDQDYKKFWNLDYLMIERVYPSIDGEIECTRADLQGSKLECNQITIIQSTGTIAAKKAFVTLVRYDSEIKNFRYELGRIHASGKNLG